jgi:S1-C subfamily serine protease
VPVDTLRRITPDLERHGEVRRAYLGVTTSDRERASGALVAETAEGGPAVRAGLRAGDVILTVDRRRVRGPADLTAAIEDQRPGRRVTIEYRRGQRTRSAEVVLGVRPTP